MEKVSPSGYLATMIMTFFCKWVWMNRCMFYLTRQWNLCCNLSFKVNATKVNMTDGLKWEQKRWESTCCSGTAVCCGFVCLWHCLIHCPQPHTVCSDATMFKLFPNGHCNSFCRSLLCNQHTYMLFVYYDDENN